MTASVFLFGMLMIIGLSGGAAISAMIGEWSDTKGAFKVFKLVRGRFEKMWSI